MKRFLSLLFFLGACSTQAALMPVTEAMVRQNKIVDGPSGPITTTGSQSAGIIEALAVVNSVKIAPGTYDVTNVIQLAPGQKLFGSGLNQTFIRYWGYSSNAGATLVGGDWVCIGINTNTIVEDMDIRVMTTNNTVFGACIGRIAGGVVGSSYTLAVGCTNAWIRRLSMHGDTDCFYWDINKFMQVTIEDCLYDSHWDALAVATAIPAGSSLTVINPKVRVNGPSFGSGSSTATALRFSPNPLTFAVRIFGGTLQSGEDIFNVQSSLEMHGTTVTNGGANLGKVDGPATFYHCPGVSYGKLSAAGGAPAYQTHLPINVTIYSDGPDTGQEAGGFNDPIAGASYWQTNASGRFRIFDGSRWRDGVAPIKTNSMVVTGAGAGAVYNGLYTFKTTSLNSLNGLVFTNYAGKFLMASTNAAAFDFPFGISDTLSLQDGLEAETSAGATIFRGWDTAGLRVEYALTNLYVATNDFVVGTRVTNGNASVWVSASILLTTAVAQPAQASLICEQGSGVTNKVTAKVHAGAVFGDVHQISGLVGPNAVYYINDESGTGATAAIVSFTCSKIQIPW